MRSFLGPLSIVVAITLSACGGSGNEAPTAATGKEYAPLAKGDRWLYAVTPDLATYPLDNSVMQLVQVSDIINLGEVTAAQVDTRHTSNLSLIERHYLRATDTALEEHFLAGTAPYGQAISSVSLLSFPLVQGESFIAHDWSGVDFGSDHDGDGVNERLDERRIVTVEGKEAISTILGDFSGALKVSSLTTTRLYYSMEGSISASMRVDEWLVAEIGVVRREVTITQQASWDVPYTSHKRYELVRYKVDGQRSERDAPQVQEPTLSPAPYSLTNNGWIKIRVPFDETIDISTVTARSLVVRNGSGHAVQGTVSYTDRELSFLPSEPLSGGIYTVTVTNVSDVIGNVLDKYEWRFTVDTSIPTDPQNLTPMAVGDRWIYDITTQENDGEVFDSRRMETVTGATTVQGRSGLVVQVRDPVTHALDREYVVEKSASTLTQLFAPGTAPYGIDTPAIPLLHLPINAGDTYGNGHWTGLDAGHDYDGDGINDTLEVTFSTSVGNSPGHVSVPAGFWSTAVSVMSEQHIIITGSATGGQAEVRQTTHEWLVPNVGSVERTTVLSSQDYRRTITQHLSGYRVGNLRSETMRPEIRTRTPASWGTKIAPTEVMLAFSEALDIGYLPTPALTVTNSAGHAVPGSLQTSSTQLRFVPDSALPDDRYHVAVANVSDLVGNTLGELSWDFTVDTTRPQVLSASIANNAVNVPTKSAITVTLSEAITTNESGVPLIQLATADGVITSYSYTSANNTLNIPSGVLQHDTTYTLTVTTAVSDSYGNALATPWTLTFTTPPAQLESPQLFHETWGNIAASAIGDVNDDGRNDLVVASDRSQHLSGLDQYTLFVFLQRADGTLDAPLKTTTYDALPYGLVCNPYSLAIGEVTGDGRTDIVLGEGYCGISVYQRADDGSWPRPASRLASSEGFRVRVGDMNNDGRLDVVSRGNGSVSLWHQLAGGGLVAAGTTTLGIGHGAMELADLNGDGLLDLALTKTASGADSDQLAVATQNGNGTFSTPTAYRTGEHTLWRMAVGDVTGDSRADLLFSLSSNSIGPHIGVFAQQANGTLGSVAFTPTHGHPYTVFAADLNNDGRTDVLSGTGNTTSILLQGDNGMLGAEDRYSGGGLLAVGDLNGDGYPDVVSSQYGKMYMTYNVGP